MLAKFSGLNPKEKEEETFCVVFIYFAKRGA